MAHLQHSRHRRHPARDEITEVYYEHYEHDSRYRRGRQQPTLASSCGGAVIGLVLLFGATALLWWNEGDAVRAQQSIREAQDALASSSSGLVHVQGDLTIAAGSPSLADGPFGISGEASLYLERRVEVFQWREHKEKKERPVAADARGGVVEKTVTYRYTSGWESKAISSGSFRYERDHRNPPWSEALAVARTHTGLPFEGRHWSQPRVLLDGAALGERLLHLAAEPREPFVPNARVTSGKLAAADASTHERAWLDGAHVYSARTCAPPREPHVGCVRVSWVHAPLREVSVVARRDARGTLVAWPSSIDGYDVLLLAAGRRDAPSMLAAAARAQSLWTWLKRGGGALLTWAGYALLFGPAQYLASWVPLLGGLAGCALSMVALGLALAHALSVIAVAWLAHRPLVAAALLVVAATSAWTGIGLLRSQGGGGSTGRRVPSDGPAARPCSGGSSSTTASSTAAAGGQAAPAPRDSAETCGRYAWEER